MPPIGNWQHFALARVAARRTEFRVAAFTLFMLANLSSTADGRGGFTRTIHGLPIISKGTIFPALCRLVTLGTISSRCILRSSDAIIDRRSADLQAACIRSMLPAALAIAWCSADISTNWS